MFGVPREERKGARVYTAVLRRKREQTVRKGKGRGKKSEAEIAGGITRVGTPFLRDLYRGGGACKVART